MTKNDSSSVVRSTSLPNDSADAPQPKIRKWRLIPVTLVVLAIGLWFAPAIIGKTPIRHQFARILFPNYSGRCHVGHAKLGWLSPVQLQNVILKNAEGLTWLELPQVETSHSLWNLLLPKSGKYGTVRFDRPSLSIHQTPEGSDFETYLNEVLTSDASSSDEGMEFTLELNQGTATWTDIYGKPVPGGVKNLQASIHQATDLYWPSPVSADFDLTNGEHSGTGQLRIDHSNASGAEPILESSLASQNLPLETLIPWLSRLGIDANGTGSISTDLVGKISATESLMPIDVDGSIDGERLRVVLDSIDQRPVVLSHSKLKGGLHFDGDRVKLNDLAVESEVGTARVTGTVHVAELQKAADWKQALSTLLKTDLKLAGSVDISKLPSVVSLPESVSDKLSSGNVRVEASTSSDETNRRGELNIQTSDVVANLPNRKVTWDAPLLVQFVVVDGPQGMTAETLKIESSFLKLNGSVAGKGGNVEFSANLDQLRDELNQFWPIQNDRLSGELSGMCTVQPVAGPNEYEVRLDSQVKNLSVSLPQGQWSEPSLQFGGTARVHANKNAISNVQLISGFLRGAQQEEVQIRSASASSATKAATTPIDFSVSGPIEQWLQRLKAWSLLPTDSEIAATGAIDLTGQAVMSGDVVQIKAFKGSIEPCDVRYGTFQFNEPRLSLEGTGALDNEKNAITSNDLSFETESLRVQAKRLHLPLDQTQGIELEVAIGASLAEWGPHLIPTNLGLNVSGLASGQVTIKTQSDGISYNTDIRIQQPAIYSTSSPDASNSKQPLWSDETARVALTGQFLPSQETLHVKQLAVTSQGAELSATGHLAQLSTRCNADFKGHIKYDLGTLRKKSPLLAASSISAVGNGNREFAFKGPLISSSGPVDQTLTGNASLGWNRIDFMGLPLNEGEITAQLQSQQVTLRTSPINVTGGRMQVNGQLALSAPLTLVIKPGRLVENVQLTPELCRSWMAYATPILADVTEVQGALSLDVNNGGVPLLNPYAARVDSVLNVHRFDAAPGKVARSILQVVQQIQQFAGRSATRGTDLQLTAPAQKTRVVVANGRVYHDQFLVRLGDANGQVIRTSGSVGFDDTVDLTVEIPLNPEWFQDERIARLFDGQTLKVPIGGTLNQPLPNTDVLRDFGRKAATNAVQGFMEKQIDKQLGDQLDGKLNDFLKRSIRQPEANPMQ